MNNEIQDWNDSPFGRGYIAYNHGLGTLDNPFEPPSEDSDPENKSDYWQWLYGWVKAEREDAQTW